MQSARPKPIVLQVKNYKINLLMDIIAVRRALKGQLQVKSHEKIKLFVQANKDILDKIEDHETLIKDILHVDEIIYYANGQEISGSYVTEMLMDIKL